MEIPHSSIREEEDRSWTARLLARFVDPGLTDEARDEIAETIERVADPRARATLVRALEDRSRPAELRVDAGWVLRSLDWAGGPAVIRGYWRDGDALLRRHALLAMGPAEVDLVAPVAMDPGHPLYVEAIRTMCFGFEGEHLEAIKIAALGHVDARVRAAAADVLVWDEPVAAEAALLRAAADSVDEVAIAALRTLVYYPSLRCVREVAARRDDPRPAVAEAARDCFVELRWSVLAEVTRDRATGALWGWLEPIEPLLAFTEEELEPEERGEAAAGRVRAVEVITAGEVVAMIAGFDADWAASKRRLRDVDPERFSGEDRALLRAALSVHPDPFVRGHACGWLACWGDRAALRERVGDELFGVRKTAIYHLGLTAPDPSLAGFVWAHLFAPGVTGTHAYETLHTYVVHAPLAEAVPRLVERVRLDARESVRCEAAYALARLGARAELEGLLDVVAEAPRPTYAVTLALLDGARRLGLTPPGIERLREIDNLHVQVALQPWLAGT